MVQVTRLNPLDIRYTQDSIACRFQTGELLEEVLKNYTDSGCAANKALRCPIKVIYDEVFQTWWSVDNRRLFVFKRLEEMGYVEDIIVRDISETQAAKRSWMNLPDGGLTVRIRSDAASPPSSEQSSLYPHRWNDLHYDFSDEDNSFDDDSDGYSSADEWDEYDWGDFSSEEGEDSTDESEEDTNSEGSYEQEKESSSDSESGSSSDSESERSSESESEKSIDSESKSSSDSESESSSDSESERSYEKARRDVNELEGRFTEDWAGLGNTGFKDNGYHGENENDSYHIESYYDESSEFEDYVDYCDYYDDGYD